MNLTDISRFRMHNQQLAETSFEQPEEVVSFFGAIQAQDYSAAKWAVALRSKCLTNSLIDQAFAEGKLLRTRILRPTWHFVTPADIRWMLELTAPSIQKLNANWYRTLGLDKEVFVKADAVISKVLSGGKQLTRSDIARHLKQSNIGIDLNNLRLAMIMLHAELDGVVCSGALKGKEHTYALLDERISHPRELTRDVALGELANRYFVSRGPATIKDFVWWSSLSTTEARRGLEIVASQLLHETIGGHDYWFVAPENVKSSIARMHLLPNYDEYIVGYTERSAIFDVSYASGLDARHNPLFQPTVVIDGRVEGTWKRTLLKTKVRITAKPFTKLPSSKKEDLTKAVAKYSKFIELPAELVIEDYPNMPSAN